MGVDVEEGVGTRPSAQVLDVGDGDAALDHVGRPSVAAGMDVQAVRQAFDAADGVLEVPAEIDGGVRRTVLVREDKVRRVKVKLPMREIY